MAESFAQRRNAVNRGLREVRKAYRRADSAGELLERELDRLIDRKMIVTPESLRSLTAKYTAYNTLAASIARQLAAAITLSTSYQ